MKWGRKHKYGAVATYVDGIRFASKAEARRYGQLKLLAAAQEIRDLKLQPKFPLDVEGFHICTYIADFSYREPGSPFEIVEDTKGVETPDFIIKAKLFRALYRDRELRVNGEKLADLKRRVIAAGMQ